MKRQTDTLVALTAAQRREFLGKLSTVNNWKEHNLYFALRSFKDFRYVGNIELWELWPEVFYADGRIRFFDTHICHHNPLKSFDIPDIVVDGDIVSVDIEGCYSYDCEHGITLTVTTDRSVTTYIFDPRMRRFAPVDTVTVKIAKPHPDAEPFAADTRYFFINTFQTMSLKHAKLAMMFLAACVANASAADDNDRWLVAPVKGSWQIDSIFEPREIDDAQWWKNFNDPILDSLVTKAVERNYDLAIAVRRIELSRQGLRQAMSAYYPQLGLTAGWSRNRMSGMTADRDVPATVTSSWNAGASMSWEIDLFGKITAKVRQSKTRVAVSRAEYAASMVALQAQVATAYINLRIYQAQMEVARSHSESQLKVVDITEARHKAGLASMLDVAQAKTVYYSTIASIPLLENSINATVNAIAVMLGEYPASLSVDLGAGGPLPDYRQVVSTGIPLDLLSRRPDIVAARRSVDAAAQALGIARSDYLPSLTLNGSVGTEAHNVKDVFRRNSFTYTIAPTLSWTIFDGFARRSATAEARENLEIEIDNYNMVVLTAVEETDNAMSAYANDLRYLSSVEEVLNHSRQARELSLDLYKRGLSPFTNVVDAQLNVLSYQNSLVAAGGDALISLINLYKALGGGWVETDN